MTLSKPSPEDSPADSAGSMAAADDWMNSKPKVRTDLRFFPQGTRDRSVVVEDPIRSKFFRIGRSVYVFISFLNGTRTIHEAFVNAQLKSESSNTEFDLEPGDLKRICNFISNAQLIHTSDSESLAAKAEASDKTKKILRFNPIFQKLPLFYPNEKSGLASRLGRILFSIPMLVLWAILIGIAAYHAWQSRIEFGLAANGILSGHRWIWMGVIWIVLKIIHEMGHAIACYRFGGYVKETGLAFICLFPVAYVDVSSSWRFQSRWHRFCVAAAGLYIELFVAAVATIAWCHVQDPLIRDVLYNLIIVSGVTALVFNLNPLMKFDGYYMLSDSLDRPGLYQESQASIRSTIDWYFFGLSTDTRYPFWVRCYGMLVLGWRIIVCVGLFIGLSLLGEGLGLLFAWIALGFWLVPMLSRFLKGLAASASKGFGFGLLRPVVAMTVFAMVLAGISTLLFLPQRIVAPGVVQYVNVETVRSQIDGFVREVYVKNGQQVEAGDLLLVLENESIQVRQQEIQLEIEQAKLLIDQYQSKGETGNALAESRMLSKLVAEQEQQESRIQSLRIHAPTAGVVQIEDEELMRDRFVNDGDELLSIGDFHNKEIVAAIPQHQFEEFDQLFESGTLDQGFLYLPETGRINTALKKIEPKASLRPANPLLCANTGGLLPIKSRPSSDGDSLKEDAVELLEPHVTATFALADEQSHLLNSGRRLRVIVLGKKKSLGYQVYKSARRWLRKKIELATARS